MTNFTRATTVANTLADRYGLEQWAQRSVVYGIGQREDLYALAASATPDDKDQLNSIVKQALEAAATRSKANLGTALHRLTERIDSGELKHEDVPTQWQPDIGAYLNVIADNNVTIHSEHIERVVLNTEWGIAGTLDRLVTVDGQLTVADLKTGHTAIEYGTAEIAMQLSIYANASHVWKGSAEDIQRDRYGRYTLPDPEKEPDAYDPMPEVDKEKALIIHLPVETGECTLHMVDLVAGYEAVAQAVWVREWRKRKDLAQPYRPGLRLIEGGDSKQTIALDDDW